MLNVIALFAAVLVAQAPPPLPPATTPGDIAYRAGDFDGAMRAYTTALAADPADANATLGVGTMDLYKNDLVDARTYLERAQNLLPNDPRVMGRLRSLAEREPRDGDFQVAMLGDEVDVPFVSTDPLPVLKAKINGQDAYFFIDTGAATVDISADAVARLHLKTKVAGEGVFAGGMKAQVKTTRLDSFAFNNLTVRGIDSDVLPRSMTLGGRKLDGAIGTVFLSHFLASIDYVHGKLILRPRGASQAFEASATAANASIVPLWLVGDHFLFASAHVNNQPDALFNIDTGGGGIGVQLTKPQLDAAKITPDATKAQSFGGGGGDAKVLPFTAPAVTIGSTTQTNVPGLYFPNDQYGIFPFKVAGTLSHLFFRPGVLTFDFDAMRLIVSKG